MVKRYAALTDTILQMVGSYVRDVREGAFPAAEHSFSIPAEEMGDLTGQLLEQEEVCIAGVIPMRIISDITQMQAETEATRNGSKTLSFRRWDIFTRGIFR